MNEVMTITYYVFTTLLTIAMSIVGFFIRQFYLNVKELTKTVEKLNTTMILESERMKNIREFQKSSEECMDKINGRVDNHEVRIVVLETKNQ